MNGNKKGQEMSVATLVLIVIGIALLVMIILGFTLGWQNLWNKINLFQGGSVEDVISSCKIAATTDAAFSYCNEFKQVTINNQKQYVNCQFPAVNEGLEKKLGCGDNNARQSAKTYCMQIYKDIQLVENAAPGATCPIQLNVTKSDSDKIIADLTLYNEKSCLTLLTGISVRTDAQGCIILKTA